MLRTESRILLPVAPADQVQHLVAAWSESVVIDTYAPEAPGRYPAYLDSRGYQGSSGRVYPLPFHERIRSESAPHNWHAVHLENENVRLMRTMPIGLTLFSREFFSQWNLTARSTRLVPADRDPVLLHSKIPR